VKLPPIVACWPLALACSAPPTALPQTDGAGNISDAELIQYASAKYDKSGNMGRRVALGKNRGIPVIVDFPCSDLCPNYTVRIIHYDVPVASCSAAGGALHDVSVPMGIAMTVKTFCFPKVLVDTWDRYVR
jgi:hypothetical protein